MSSGKIVQIIGAVIDVEFPRDAIPAVNEVGLAGPAPVVREQERLAEL